MQDLISTKRAAKRLGVSIWTIYDFIKANDIPFYRLGHRIVFSEEKVLKWLETRKEMGYKGKMTLVQVEAIEQAPYPKRKPFGLLFLFYDPISLRNP